MNRLSPVYGGSLGYLFLLSLGLLGLLVLAPQTVRAQDGYRIDVGGYGSFRLDASEAVGEDPSFTLRRFVVTTDARLGTAFQVYSEIEYERLSEIEIERGVEAGASGIAFEQELEGTNASEIALEQAWGQLNISDHVGLRFGAVLPPVGRFNLLHDDNLWNFPQRPLIDRAAQVLPGSAAWTEMGLGISGAKNFASGARIDYQAYLLTGTTLDFAIEEVIETSAAERNEMKLEAVVSPTSGAFDGSNAADAGAARLAFSPSLGNEYAISGYIGQYTPDFLDVDENIATLGLDLRRRLGSFYVEGEFLHTWYSNVDRVLQNFAATAIDQATETEAEETATLKSEVEIEINGLADRRYGFWFDVGRPIALASGTLGFDNAVLTPTIRYERVWLENTVSEFGFANGTITALERADAEQDRLWVGVAFEPIPQAVFHLFYKRSNALEGSYIAPVVEAENANEAIDALAFGMAVGF